jgi:signal transduction histidine kinase
MRLHRYIDEHLDEILAEWEAFARTLGPAADHMSSLALRDHAKDILREISLDMKTQQNAGEQYRKSRGIDDATGGQQSAAAVHGALRQASDFSLLQLSSEFRALRATVLRMWLPQITHMESDAIYEMVRFNEGIDQALAESVVTYSARAEHTRELFLAVLGHDLRSPLSTMRMSGEMLAQPGLPGEEISHIGARIRRGARLMSSMVDDLLGYTRTQLGSGMPMKREDGNIKTICESSIEDAGSSYPGSRFDIDVPGDLQGRFDNVRLHQLFNNLLVNAAQYGSKEHAIKVRARGEAHAVVVQVTNHGSVIPEGSLQSIFKPLVQLTTGDANANASRPRTSLGLGLFVAREIALSHGGELSVTSNEQDGTTFTLRLPKAETGAKPG